MSNVYAMISTRSSSRYTELALDSFLKNTKLNKDDRFILIDNDDTGDYYKYDFSIMSNHTPQSFSKNINNIINAANGDDVFILSNDVIFTPDWSTIMSQYGGAILLPSCNQTHLYSKDNLNLTQVMSIDDYNNNLKSLSEIVQHHYTTSGPLLFENLLMAFYVFRLPASVYEKVGYFDESFIVGGGEDVDYRIRAIQAGIAVKYFKRSYLLHFQGKSTWDGTEKTDETNDRNNQYTKAFIEKWGEDLANLCLSTGNPHRVIQKYHLEELISKQEFSKAIKTVLNNSTR